MTTLPNPTAPGFPLVIEDARPLACQYLKPADSHATVTGTNELVLLDTTVAAVVPYGSSTVSGPGNLERIEIYLDATEASSDRRLFTTDGIISFYRDGEVSPSIRVNLGHLLNFYGVGLASQTWSSRDIGFDYNGYGTMGGHRTLFCPYTTSLKVTFTAAAGATGTANFFTQIYFRRGLIPTWRGGPGTRRAKLKQSLIGSNASPWSAVAGLANQNLINISGRGELEGVQMFLESGNANTSCLEGHVKVTIDGTQTIEVGGTEDFFGGHVYFTLPIRDLSRGGMTSTSTNTSPPPLDAGPGSSMYRLWGIGRDEQLAFNSSLLMNWTNGQASVGDPGSVNLACNVFYYTDH